MNAIVELTRELCRYRSGVVADDNAALFERISKEIPLRILRYPSDREFNGWVVPRNWKVSRATISKDGKVLFDGAAHALGVAEQSKSFSGRLDLESLRKRVVTDKKRPAAYVYHCVWQYRPWAADWAFCIPYETLVSWTPGNYDVDLETVHERGEMLVGEFDHKGRTDATIVFNAHTCHPHMANDGFCGVATIIKLLQWLSNRDTHYTYKAVFGPEHIGTVFYLAEKSRSDIERLVSGVFVEMTGTPFPIKAASTFLGGRMIDAAFHNVLRHRTRGFVMAPWRNGAGNDETVWEAPGYEVPFVELTRCRDLFDPFPEYHTNLDTADSLIPEAVDEVFEALKNVVDVLEENARVFRRFNGLIALSNPRYDLYIERPDPAFDATYGETEKKWGALLDSLMRYFDGSMTILEIAEKHDLPFDELLRYIRRFRDKDLVEMKFAPIVRSPIS